MPSATAGKMCQHICLPIIGLLFSLAAASPIVALEPRTSEFSTDSFTEVSPVSDQPSSRRVASNRELKIRSMPVLNKPFQHPVVRPAVADQDVPPHDLPGPSESADLMSESIRPLAKINLDVLAGQENQPGDYYYSRNVEAKSKPYVLSGSRFQARYDFHWEASNLFHKPLYFEDVALERHGQTYPSLIQPFISSGAFLFNFASLPYRMELDSPTTTIYTLGYERPGNYTPPVMERIPFSAEAAMTQASAIVSGAYLFP